MFSQYSLKHQRPTYSTESPGREGKEMQGRACSLRCPILYSHTPNWVYIIYPSATSRICCELVGINTKTKTSPNAEVQPRGASREHSLRTGGPVRSPKAGCGPPLTRAPLSFPGTQTHFPGLKSSLLSRGVVVVVGFRGFFWPIQKKIVCVLVGGAN